MSMLFCLECGREYDLAQPLWRCECGGVLDLHSDPVFPVDALEGRPATMWRYREALTGLDESDIVSLGEPVTPLIPTDHPGLFLKLDFLFPTGSFKDRGAAAMLSKVKELGINEVIEDSSGNAGAAIAAYSAKAGVRCRIFVPAGITGIKAKQIQVYGAELVKVEGQRAAASRAAREAAQTAYYASHYWNPYFFEGTKTAAFEIWEQLGRRAPSNIVTPVGHGTMLIGLYKGFDQLARAGVIDQLPRLHGVQTSACAPLVEMFRSDLAALPVIQPQPTLAEGIAIDTPLRWHTILKAIHVTEGSLVQVEELAIQESLRSWARRGTLMEPTSATATAAYDQLIQDSVIDASETTIVILTGAGIKGLQYW